MKVTTLAHDSNTPEQASTALLGILSESRVHKNGVYVIILGPQGKATALGERILDIQAKEYTDAQI